jgi:hypothetical protein
MDTSEVFVASAAAMDARISLMAEDWLRKVDASKPSIVKDA